MYLVDKFKLELQFIYFFTEFTWQEDQGLCYNFT